MVDDGQTEIKSEYFDRQISLLISRILEGEEI